MKTPPFQKGGASFPSKESGVFFNFNVPVHAKVALEIIALLFHVDTRFFLVISRSNAAMASAKLYAVDLDNALCAFFCHDCLHGTLKL